MHVLIFAALFAAGCAATPKSSVVLGVEIEPVDGRPVRWPDAADVIAECAARLDDPRALNGLSVLQLATPADVGRNCLSMEAAACYLSSKKLAIVSPRDDHELPGYCHEVGHYLIDMRTGESDHCHLQSEVWKAIDGSTCTCRCPEPKGETGP